MLGTLRFFLALFVALGHANVDIMGFNPGVVSVVCFYLISGYVMTGLLRSHYDSVEMVPYFYLDRALRLMPQYLLIAGVTLAWFLASGKVTLFLRHAPSAGDLLNNLLVVPLNYFMFNQSDSFTLIPPSWSLGAEWQFYFLMPLLLLLRLRATIFAAGLLVYGMAAFALIDTNIFGYRLLPGVLTFFLLGSALFDAQQRKGGGKLVIAVVLLSSVLAAILRYNGLNGLLYNGETLLGLCLGMPLLYLLGPMKQKTLDARLGDLSYGIFLNHFLIQWILTGVPTSAAGWAAYFGTSIALSALTQRLVERAVLAWRRRLRTRAEEHAAAPEAVAPG
jgi:peptidoglycan/LPS O-acetylase OafA/YrhL